MIRCLIYHSLVLAWLIALPGPVWAADGVSVTATVDRNQVGLGDVINLTVQVSSQNSTNIDSPKVAALPGFDVINQSSGTETRSTYANGRFMTEQARTFQYMLAVTQKGILTIPEISVTVEGKTYKTQPIKISATNARPTQPQRQQAQPDQMDQMDEVEDLFNQMVQRHLGPQGAPGQAGRPGHDQQLPINPDEAFFVHAETDKQKVYVGEQITASFYLYTRGQIRDIDTLKYPDLKGFWKEELEMATRLNFEQALVNGIAYQRALLVSYALFPIKSGKTVIDSYKAKCTVITPANFGFGRPYQFTKASMPIDIEVLDVPSAGRPENFSGAVGNFRVSASFEPPTGSVNQPVTLRVRFEGHGNAKLIELPKIDLPPTFELYDQKNQAKYMKDGTSFKEFEVLIIPREPGVFKIAPVSSAVFDPQSKKFTTISSQPLNLAVTGTATAPGAQPTATPGQKTAPPKEQGPPPLATEMDVQTVNKAALPAVTVAVYLAVLGFLGVQSWRTFRGRPKRASLNLVLKMRGKNVRALAAKGEWRKVGVAMTNTIYYILGQISEQGGASQELQRLLEFTPPSLRDELSKPLHKLITQCETLSFAPEAMVGDLREKPKLNALISEFDSVMNRAIQLAEI